MSETLGFITSEPARRNGPRESRKFNNDDAQLISACTKLDDLISTLEAQLSAIKTTNQESIIDTISNTETATMVAKTRSRN